MLRSDLRMLFFQKVLDHLLSVMVILLLMGTAIVSYRGSVKMAEVCARISSSNDLRVDILYTLALTGEWPRDAGEIVHSRSPDTPYAVYSGDEVDVKDGVITIRTSQGSIAGETISLRPAIPAGNRVGPVSWVVGSGIPRPDRHVLGVDGTTIDQRWIPFTMR